MILSRYRKRLHLRLLIVLGLLIFQIGHSLPSAFAHNGTVLSAFARTTVTINGALGTSEWITAATTTFTITTHTGTIYVMNDNTNLYIAIKITDPTPGNDQITLFFDNNHNGNWADGTPGEDLINYFSPPAVSTGFHDEFESSVGTNLDTNDGGTSDGGGAAGTVTGNNIYEFSHPLCSGDSHDFCLSSSQSVGFAMRYFHDNSFEGDWPVAVSHGTSASSWADIRIAGALGNINIYPAAGAQREPELAVNPAKTSNIVVGFNDRAVGAPGIRYVYTTNGGGIWTNGGGLPQGSLAGSICCDSWLDFDSAGNLFFAGMTFNNEIAVWVGTPNGAGDVGPAGFSSPVIVASSNGDKPALAVDRTGGTNNGKVYVVWTDFYTAPGAASACVPSTGTNCNDRIRMRVGTFSGGTLTFASAITVSPGSSNFNQGPQVAVASNGDVYAVYASMTTISIPTANQILYSRSTNGGSSFATTGGLVTSVTPVSWCISNTYNGARHSSFPSLAITPSGTLIVVWADTRWGDDDVLMVRSATQGSSWSTPILVNNDKAASTTNGRDQFMPSVTATPGGSVDVIFYDRRDDPGDTLLSLYHATSSNDGVSISSNQEVTTALSDPNVFGHNHCPTGLGDYVALTSSGGLFGDTLHMVWTDARNGNTSPRDYNTDIFYAQKYYGLFISIPYHILFPARNVYNYIAQKTLLIPMRILSAEGFNGSIILSADVPPGADYSFSQNQQRPPFNTTLTVMTTGLQAGDYPITVHADDGSGNIKNSTLNMSIMDKAFIVLSASLTDPGHLLGVQGQGFTASSNIQISFDGVTLATAQSDGQGSFSATITVPQNTPDGTHSVTAKDSTKQASATVTSPTPAAEEAETGAPLPPPTAAPTLEPVALILITALVTLMATRMRLGKRRT